MNKTSVIIEFKEYETQKIPSIPLGAAIMIHNTGDEDAHLLTDKGEPFTIKKED